MKQHSMGGHQRSLLGAIMDFKGNLLTCYGKTYWRAFLSWIAGMDLSILHHWCPQCCLLNNKGLQYLRTGDEQIVIANPVLLFQHIPSHSQSIMAAHSDWRVSLINEHEMCWSQLLRCGWFFLHSALFYAVLRKNPSSCYQSPSVGDHVSESDSQSPQHFSLGYPWTEWNSR